MKNTAALLCCLTLIGCSAFPPQNIELEAPQSLTFKIPQPVPVEVVAKDSRTTTIIGDRIDKLSNRAVISLVNAADWLKAATEQAVTESNHPLGTNGYLITSNLKSLSYQATLNTLSQEVQVNTALEVSVAKNGEHYTGKYQSEMKKVFLGTPTVDENNSLINQLLADTLKRAFSDPNLQTFMLKNR